jgi:hypothetical protein
MCTDLSHRGQKKENEKSRLEKRLCMGVEYPNTHCRLRPSQAPGFLWGPTGVTLGGAGIRSTNSHRPSGKNGC